MTAPPEWLVRLDRWPRKDSAQDARRNDLAPSLGVFFSTLLDALESDLFRIDDEGRAIVAEEDAMNTPLRSRGVCFDRYDY